MKNESEIKQCQNCKKDFVTEPDDFSFYEKIKVPPPTFCPECRLVRRMIWRNERSLFHRICDYTGEKIITMFHPEANVKVYDRDIWWSDKWDSTEYGIDYDFSKPFFEQFKELLSKVPLQNLGNNNCINSPYGNHNADCKNCYLVYASYLSEDVMYSQGASSLKNCIDVYSVQKGEDSYGDVFCDSIFNTHFSSDSDSLIDSFFVHNCRNCQNCIGCINLRNKNYCIFNEQYSKKDYLKIKEKLDFGSYKKFFEFKNKYKEFTIKHPYKYASLNKAIDCTGDYVMNSKNTTNSFDIYGDIEDSKYVVHGGWAKDIYDCYGFGASAYLLYEGVDTGLKASNVYFSVLTHSCMNTYYTYMCFNSKNLFGCIGIRKGEYYILNKKYTKEQYEELVPKIIEHMSDMPYISKVKSHKVHKVESKEIIEEENREIIYRYGEFFPPELSPFAYNETIAQEYFSKTKDGLIKEGYSYRLPQEKDYQITIENQDLPDHIKDVFDNILKETIGCPNKGNELTKCTFAYRIHPEELSFLKKHNITLPRYCPNCRHYERLAQRNPLKLWHRSCMKEGCNNEFETSYAPDRPEIVYCERCYQNEVY